MSSVHRIPSSPKMRNEWSEGAIQLEVSRAPRPDPNLRRATEKSGGLASRGTSVSLSLIWHDEKAVTVSTGPKNAVRHVTAYAACSIVHPTSNSSLCGQGIPNSFILFL